MRHDRGVLGLFGGEREAVKAVRALREERVREFTVFSPVPSHALHDALGAPRSAVSAFTLGGALLGVALGFGLSVYAGSKWGLVTSGKPVVAWIPFMVVAFELAVLLGALGNFLSMILFSGLGRFGEPPAYDASFSRDRFGVFTPCGEDGQARLEGILRSSGALEVRMVSEGTSGSTGGDE